MPSPVQSNCDASTPLQTGSTVLSGEWDTHNRSFANPTPLAYADTSRDVLPKGRYICNLKKSGKRCSVLCRAFIWIIVFLV
ncbi:hypothetical protein TNCV_2261231 [Trichonephila clavipes]|nr:hypothetical protein TNCV_2261231 [Trichonephila clavipes]